jgi:cyclophilin family peptidyl-prolyl cis-trans isomerase
VRCWTSDGPFTIDLVEEWAPNGVAHFLDLVEEGYYDDQLVFRSEPGFVLAQFGHHKDRLIRLDAQERTVEDDEDRGIPFELGTVSFAGNARGRNTVIFVAGENAGHLGKEKHERPIGKVVGTEDLRVLRQFPSTADSQFGPHATQPAERYLQEGNDAALVAYPFLKKILQCRREDAWDFDVKPVDAIDREKGDLDQRLTVEATAEVKAWRARPSVATLPPRFVAACEACHGKKQAFCVSTQTCVDDQPGACALGPQDHMSPEGSDTGASAVCTKEEIFGRWPFEPCIVRPELFAREAPAPRKSPEELMAGLDLLSPELRADMKDKMKPSER